MCKSEEESRSWTKHQASKRKLNGLCNSRITSYKKETMLSSKNQDRHCLCVLTQPYLNGCEEELH